MKPIVLLLCCLFLSPVIVGAQSGFGLVWEDTKARQDSLPPLLIKAMPPTRLSYKAYCPPVLDQQDKWACVGYACGYYLMTMVDAINQRITDNHQINKIAYSAGYLYEAIKPSTDVRCQAGAKLSTALDFLKTNGTVRQNLYPYEPCQSRPPIHDPEKRFRLGDFSILFSLQHPDNDQKIQRLKMALWAGYPVVVGLAAPNSFREAMSGKATWVPTTREQTQVQTFGGHALCVIGYDDTRYGGAFEVVNSFGTQWGQDGFGWIPYRVMTWFARLGYQVYGNPIRKGETILPDESTAAIAFQLLGGETIPLLQVDSTNRGTLTGTIKQSDGKGYTIVLKNSQPTYVYLFELGSAGLLNRIIPQTDLPEYSPATTDWHDLLGAYTWTVDAISGQDQFLMLLSQQPLAIETLERQLNGHKLQPTAEGISSVCAQLGLPPSITGGLSIIASGTAHIRWSPGMTVIPLLITIRHD